MSADAPTDGLLPIEPSCSSSHPLCDSPSFEMYHFHPIDEPEVSVDVSGLFDSPASQQHAASEALSSPSSSAAEAAVPQTPDAPASLRRPVPIAAATAKADPTSRATSPSVVSSDDEGDGDDDEEDGAHGIPYEPWVFRWGDDREDERLPCGEEGGLYATCWPGKRSVSDLSAQGSEGGAEGPDGDDDLDDGEAPQAPPRKKPKAAPQDDAQRRARVLLWRQSLKRSLFQLEP
jgi:hypothetical protein